ncbi:protein of unknown function [Methylocaldum szegediense]|uniref:Uncharacterized protein n=1 Tax=Methylocaldum szegediense TaxID=73780 RepID=A0ABN8X7P5_9GAMM|nr:protein of unknown function [Methylocaldum szegediense]
MALLVGDECRSTEVVIQSDAIERTPDRVHGLDSPFRRLSDKSRRRLAGRTFGGGP